MSDGTAVNSGRPATPAELPLFPLNTVLFPGGVLPLRIFEARYMDMARDCLANASPFGVCLITEGQEVGEAASHETIGCTATIADWDMQQLGLLQVRAIGGRRFRVLSRRVQPDGLIRAEVQTIDDDQRLAVPPEYEACVTLARRLVDELVEREPDPTRRMVVEPYDYDSSAWVGNRLCEFLPIPPKARQELMALDDPITRLSLIQRYLQRHRVI